MEIRVLQYFLTIAQEGSINRAASVLHITQPTLSRQISAMEEELNVQLFDRNGKKLQLTEEGRLLRRRAEEILSLIDRTENELHEQDSSMEGRIVIGCGELSAVENLSHMIGSYHSLYPRVQFDLITETSDLIQEQLAAGKLDIGVLLEPIEIEKFDFIRLKDSEHWAVMLSREDPLCEKETIRPEDLIGSPLILPRRAGVKNELENWFGENYKKLDILFTSNMSTNGAVMVRSGLARYITLEAPMRLWDDRKICIRSMDPPLASSSVLAWRKYMTNRQVVTRFIDHIYAYRA